MVPNKSLNSDNLVSTVCILSEIQKLKNWGLMEVLNQNLPEEIQMNILSCLPVKSLLRFRCVSKQFRSLISDPYFVKFHLNRSLLSKNNQKVFLSSFPPQSIDYETLLDNRNHNKKNALVELDCPSYSYVTVIGSCNGLICYVVDHKVIIYNPSTRVSKELPKPPIKLCLILDYYGFGFDDSDNDYKVVWGVEIVGEIVFHMFCLRQNYWRRIQPCWGCNYLGNFPSRGNGIFLNGALHWLLMKTRVIGSEKLRVIVYFDLSKEAFSEMSLDNIEGQSQSDLKFYMLGALDECLYALSPSFTANGTSVEMWLMKEYGGKASWAKFITFPCYVKDTCLKPLCFLRNGELLVANDPSCNNQIRLESYNTKMKGFTRISSCPRSFEADLYAESLVNPTALI